MTDDTERCPIQFERLRTPRPSADLKDRALQAAFSAPRTPPILRTLDTLWSSRLWWLSWAAAVLVCGVLAREPGSASSPGRFTAEAWREYRGQVAAMLTDAAPVKGEQAAHPGGAA